MWNFSSTNSLFYTLPIPNYIEMFHNYIYLLLSSAIFVNNAHNME